MTVINLSNSAFPSLRNSERGQWAPIYLNPVRGSEERLVIGVAVIGRQDLAPHIETANAIERLHCLYGTHSDIVIQAARIGMAELLIDMQTRGLEALSSPRQVVTSVSVGDIRPGAGRTLEAIGVSWMASLSSLYDIDSDRGEMIDDMLTDDEANKRDAGGDRLPKLVLNYVMQQELSFAQYFRADLMASHQTRRKSHEIIIDYSGPRLTANFGTIRAGRISQSVDLIKRRLWDLKVKRDGDHNLRASTAHQHEMLVQVPPRDDPQITERQLDNLWTAQGALEKQADLEHLRLQTFTSVEQIGERVLRIEAVNG